MIQATGRWLRIEQEGRDAASEAAFREVWAELVRSPIPDGLTDRVVTRQLTSEPVPTVRSRRWRRRLVRAVLTLAGAGLAVVTLAVLARPGVALLVGTLQMSARGFVWVVQALSSGLDVWTILTRAGQALGTILASPQVTLVLAAVELVAVGALYGLHRVLARDREKDQ